MTRTRDPLVYGAALLLLWIGTTCTLHALRWVGEPFPGFLVLENSVVATAGLTRWPATRAGDIYQSHIVSVDGQAPSELPGGSLQSYVSELPAGTPVAYELQQGAIRRTRTISTRIFGAGDFVLLFGAYLLCGVGMGGVALCIRFLRGRERVAYGTFVPLYLVALWALTAVDVFGPYRFFRLHVLAESLLFGGAIHMALTFPAPSKWVGSRPGRVWIPYAAAAPVSVAGQLGLADPETYIASHLAAKSLFGLALVALVGSQLGRLVWSRSFETRQRVKVLAIGTVAALAPQVVVMVWSMSTQNTAPENLVAFTGVLFPISVGYAVLHHNIMGVDELLRRALHYALFALAVAVSYMACLTGFDALFQGTGVQRSAGFAFFFGAFAVLGLLPLGHGIRRILNQSVFRTTYDFSRIVERSSQRMASATDLPVIAGELTSAVGGALRPDWVALYLRRRERSGFEAIETAPLSPGRIAALMATVSEAHTPVEDDAGHLAVPFRVDGRLRAVLFLGPRRTGRRYTGDDRRLLQTLANQGAVAIQNALALDELREVNHELEWRVANRTRELDHALAELRDKNQLLTHLSTTDAVTNLRNRAYVDDALRSEFERARRYGSDLSVLMVDIDRFKSVNDEHGHQVGDAVLRRVGEIISENLRSSDVAGRFGGEEFLVVLTQSSAGAGGLMFAERLRGNVEHEVFHGLEGRTFHITLSIGVVSLQPRHDGAEALVGEADAALYRAKSGGRNRVEMQLKA